MKTIKNFLYFGYDKDTITKCRSLMDIDNIKMINKVCILLIIVLGALITFYTSFDNDQTRNLVCIGSITLLIIILCISMRLLKREKPCKSIYVDILMTVLSTFCLLVGIYMGTHVLRNEFAVAPIWLFFFVVLAFNRMPLQNILLLTIFGFIFLFSSHALKDSYHFEYDAMHAFISILSSLFVSWPKTKMKIENILVLQRLENINSSMKERVKEHQEEAVVLRHRAQTDELSGFYTKQFFENNAITILQQKADKQHALICCDIDDFKKINDSFGHLYGDKVLKEVVDTILKTMNLDKVCGRFGGDEFTIFIEEVADREEIFGYINKMCQSCNKTYKKYGIEQHISLSLGVAFYPEDGNQYIDLFKVADKRLYDVKNRKKAKHKS